MLVAAAVCPCPPLLVPEVASGAAPELDPARTACADALGVLAASRPDRLLVIGPAPDDDQSTGTTGTTTGTGTGTTPGTARYPEGTWGSFHGFGVDRTVRLGGGTPATSPPPLPPSLAVAAWLLERTGWADAPIEGHEVREPLGAERCIQIGREFAAGPDERIALLVMGDASACRTLKAPGYLDERAEPYDKALARAIGAADVAALKALDPALSRDLKVSGRAPWQILAGAAEAADLSGTLLYEDAPYGVGYLVATWS
ncbi:class III extradiol dioxygenase subunit B-like domain-containing protein [Streptomyces sp. NPDC048290]|uniref:class III extradiol dioxygenase subunit B-like domain-containing protein n=1 Tax=Streptomyces sp. NPDC048290 TaxID=3155811 RepID=UPI00342F9EE3